MSDDHSAHDRLIARVDEAFEAGLPPVPERLVVAARDAFAWRLVDAELAELTFDSASDELVGLRGTSTERRSFRYSGGDVTVRVHVTADTIVVMVEPPLSVSCRIASAGAVLDLRTDEMGELVADAPEPPVRLELDLPSGRLVTPWITA